jgi:site-specific DNA-methyltransferase (adenine-specific)
MKVTDKNIELNKIYCESNLETMAKMPDNFIDLTVTSPPYDNLRNYNGYSFPFENIANELFRVTKNGGVVVWIVGDATINGSESGTSFKQALYFKDIGFNLHDTMMYRKINYIPLTHNRYEQEFEYMFVFSKGKPKTFNPIMVECKTKGSKTNGRTFYQTKSQNTPTEGHKNDTVKEYKQKGNVWEIPTNAGTKGHPAQFPEQLAHDHIVSWSNENDLVYDCFMGSGTTAKMAHLQKRRWIGSEMSKEYVDLANKRLQPYLSQKTLF